MLQGRQCAAGALGNALRRVGPPAIPHRQRCAVLLRAAPASAAAVQVVESPYQAELQHAKEAVRLAARMCQTVQRQLVAAEKADKQDDSPVTVADYAAQAVVAWSLQRSSPAARISMVAEEDSAELRTPEGRPMLLRITELINTVVATVDPAAKLTPEAVVDLIDLGGSQGGPVGRHWVLDPIDGTRGFVAMRQYSVCLGMLQDGEVVLGVLGCPNLPQGAVQDEDGGGAALERSADNSDFGCLFAAERGHGAFQAPLWDAAAPQTRIRTEDLPAGAAARFMESYESRHSNHSLTAQVAREVGVVLPPLRMDSQVKYGLLSRGAASIFMRFPPPTYKEKIWDHCAGFVIVEEAGGKVTDAAGTRLDFSKGRYLQLDKGIIAAPPALHTELVKAVAAVTARNAAGGGSS